MISASLIAMAAFFLDTVLGDPQSRWHPVAVLGRFIAFLERLLYPTNGSDQRKFAMGAFLTLLVLCISYGCAEGLLLAAHHLPIAWGADVVSVVLLYFCISPRMLAKAGQDIYTLLVKGDLPAAREHVGYIVGRDTAQLDEADAARATIETVAENTVDGIIAPLFFFAFGGAPLAVLYRAANTMDSMLGYKNERYLYFGRMAARVDDTALLPVGIGVPSMSGGLPWATAWSMRTTWSTRFSRRWASCGWRTRFPTASPRVSAVVSFWPRYSCGRAACWCSMSRSSASITRHGSRWPRAWWPSARRAVRCSSSPTTRSFLFNITLGF